MRGILAGVCFAAVAAACETPDLMLKYPALARQARIAGRVSAALSWDMDGRLVVTREDGHTLLYQSISDAIQQVSFPSDCAGKALKIAVEFGFLDCFSERTHTKAERTSASEWRVLTGKPYAIASGEQRVRRRFPFSFLHKSVGFCLRSPSDGTPCPAAGQVD
jgi:hypothetical protein